MGTGKCFRTEAATFQNKTTKSVRLSASRSRRRSNNKGLVSFSSTTVGVWTTGRNSTLFLALAVYTQTVRQQLIAAPWEMVAIFVFLFWRKKTSTAFWIWCDNMDVLMWDSKEKLWTNNNLLAIKSYLNNFSLEKQNKILMSWWLVQTRSGPKGIVSTLV